MNIKIFDTLRHIIQDVNNAPDFEQALNIIVQRTRDVMQVDAVSVYFLDDKTKKLVLMATDGLNPKAIGKIRFNLDQGLVGLVFKQAESVNIKDAHAHPNYCFVTETDEISFHGFLGVPIIQHRNVLGVLVVRQTRQRRFSANDETFLITLAAQLAGAISHAEIRGELTHFLEDDEGHSFNMKGLSGSPGIAIGEAVVVYPPASLEAVPDNIISADEVDDQINLFTEAVENVDSEFKELSKKMQGVISSEELALFDVFSLMLKSDSLIDSIIKRIKAGQWAQAALRETIGEHVKQFDEMDDAYFRERAIDIKDLGRRILMHLQLQTTALHEVSGPVVLVGEEITVSQFSEVPLENLVAIISSKGSASSHVAILSRALGIASVVGIDNLPVNHIKGQQIVVDGYNGQIYVKPSVVILDEFRRLISEEKLLDDELNELIDKPSETLDGVHIPLYANTGLLQDISPSLKCGAEGVGLYRTEVPFLIRDGFPGEDEQTEIYKQVLQSFSPRPVTFRTLDIGGDKALPYFPIVEDNPFLGWRGIRIMLDHPEIFLTQIRAILKANIYENNLRLMLPMISDISEVDMALELINKAHKDLNDEGIDTAYPLIGLMIEVPSAVYQMDALAKRVDFFSVGSNDLTQYLLAVDRNNKQVAGLYNSMHPSVLMSIQQVVKVAHKHNKPVSVCGEMAGDPVSALALVGMGIDSLSMSSGSVLKVKWTIRSFTQQQTKELIDKALTLENVSDIRLLFEKSLDAAGLGSLVRAGK
ncbi:MAG: phosphoenolpyruvate--protein phosphotransferase [Gammaproteobacteria bacterium]|nr:phosphoenolpyruvate--protein phosphotransferase [Gammaproteobacteria bacterium]